MAISWLQNKINAANAGKTLIDVLRTNMGGYEKARDHTEVHASDITKPGFCPKQWALLDITDKKKKDSYVNTALRATFDVGNVTSDLVREKWAGDSAHGFWKCTRCNHTSAFGTKPVTTCSTGGKCDYKYKEVRFVSEDYGVSGSIDVFMDLGGSKLWVTEVKIITPVDFEELAAPLAEHRIRTNLYMKLIEDDPSVFKHRINLTKAKVLYVSRAHGKKHVGYKGEILPFKEFDVERNDASLKPYLDKAVEVKVYRDKGLIPKGVCVTAMDATAKACSVCAECFSGKYKTGEVHQGSTSQAVTV